MKTETRISLSLFDMARRKEKEPKKQRSAGASFFKFIPLGGMGEVTKNMYVYETPNDMVVIDCGIGFPKE